MKDIDELRDELAGKAMTALIIADSTMAEEKIARLAYEQADAMLKARE